MKNKKTKLAIDGKFVDSFESIKLEQSMYDHHRFTVVIDHDMIEKQGEFTLNNSKEWLGKSVLINFENYDFVGYIQQIKLVNQGGGHNGDLVLTGYSSTIKLEGNPHTEAFLERDLETIVEKTIQGVNIHHSIKPEFKGEVPYVAQYKETHYNFLKRLARDFNQWLYYDGSQVIFGRQQKYDPITLEYGSDLLNIEIAMQTKPTDYNLYGYDPISNEYFEGENQKEVEGLNELGYDAWEASQGFYKKPIQGYAASYVANKIASNFQRDRLEKAQSADTHILKATSEAFGLELGRVIRIRSARFEEYMMGDMKFKRENYGDYVVTKITHYAEPNGVYRNEFEALPGGITVLPLPENIKTPVAEPQLAEVTSNEDPEGKGRVQVTFPWMAGTTAQSPFMRVMTPDAGSSSNHSKNRGQVFIPEVGDQVMVGFEQNDPSKPFVMGSMYHGQNHSGGGQDNNIKSIITKSGHEIVFNDTPNGESITITDKKKNFIIIDTENETISINALKDINITAGENINMSAGKNIIVNAGDNIEETAGSNIKSNAGTDIIQTASGDIKEKSNNIKQIADQDFDIISKKSVEYSNKVDIQSLKGDIDLLSNEKINLNSKEKSNLF